MAKVCLIVIDGWGISEEKDGNAIAAAETPVMTKLSAVKDKYTTLDASGLSVGLPRGLMGNSEVGHMNCGAGRVCWQDIVRINLAVENKSLYTNGTFVSACERAKSGNGRLHLLGLVSDGGVHSHIDHLLCMLEGAKMNGVKDCFVQYFGDGRDTIPTSGVGYVKKVQDHMKANNYGTLATVVGRYFAMDRDKRWERIKIAYEGLVQGIGETCAESDVTSLMQKRYDMTGAERQTDEFLKPIIASQDGRIKDNDTLIFIDFRADRMRQITEAFGVKTQFETSVVPKNIAVNCMTRYNAEWSFPLLFPPVSMKNVLAEAIANNGVSQFHCAETEKYAHVTFFFNGGVEQKFDKEERKLVSSPKVATYDLQPEMSCAGVADEMVATIKSGKHPFVMCNFAPPDMVGHTGVYEATVKAVTATDVAIGRVHDACMKHGYVFFLTSDHGNAEKMFSEFGGPHTAHTTNRVPFILSNSVNKRVYREIKHNAALCDVGPTVLDMMGFAIPKEMDGQTLLA